MYSFSLVLIVPASLQDQANRIACAIGHDELPGNTYAIPLSGTGLEPATHYGAHTWAQREFIANLYATGAFPPPALEVLGLTNDDVTAAQAALAVVDWAASGVTEQDVSDVAAALIATAQIGGVPRDNWSAALTSHSLVQVG